jgi:deazaflavin-dependent oxidoreductase (nitroreductase family)
MPLPEWLARANRRVTNHVLGPLARHVPPLAIVRHTGRSSGRVYETPVLAFPQNGRIAIALTYGPDTDWIANVMAHGGAAIIRRNRERRFVEPTIRRDPDALELMPMLIRPPLRLLRVTNVLVLTEAPQESAGSTASVTPA